MTTTLRPLGPEQSRPDGGRERAFEVRVNGRTVGGLVAAASGGPGPRVGGIRELTIHQADRGRGRGTVAVLAAEEVLRSWGCVRADIGVPDGPDRDAGLALARTLGYTLRGLNMRKELPADPPSLPEGSTGRPMRQDEFDAWLAEESAGYVDSQIAAGMTPEQARTRSQADHAAALPDGLDTPGAVISRLESGGVPVGAVWVGTQLPGAAADEPPAWVFMLSVDERYRGRGHGRALMLLAERECLARGVRELGLHVFAANAPAVSLYRSLGYRTYRSLLHKQL
ncbi:GNAT family N-acetyltransferase [Streptacidiphilus carbonis]|uniref:GNAT family N-acetyltransferase n=1 Tax=Streptacidiphilus carbonis TaxID=105422 RepID=UPI0005A79A0E|nr:GNAT family N-acetyltransferase [Streptacidiphilus carbonis]